VISTYLYDGTGTSFSGPGQTITNGIDLAGEGGMVWLKARNSAEQNLVIDTVRGGENRLITNDTNAAGTDTGYHISSFNSDGFSLQANGTGSNRSAYNYASWTFRKQPGFFDFVTYTGNGTNQAISHNLDSTPGMIIVKRTDSSTNGSWVVYHRGTSASPQNDYMILQTTQGVNQWTDWNQTAPTSTQFEVGSVYTNTSGATYVAYLFAHDAQEFGTDSDESIIKCGSYTGNGSTTGPVIDLGFEPQFILAKNTSTSGYDWFMHDSMRGMTAKSGGEPRLMPNLSSAEAASIDYCTPTATGFQVATNSAMFNKSGDNFIYVAIRRPHKPAEEFAATDLFAIDTSGGTSPTPPRYNSGFPVDLVYQRTNISATNAGQWWTRITASLLYPSLTDAESTSSAYAEYFSNNEGFQDLTTVSSTNYAWMFRRAPGFFDVVAYTGEIGASGTGHNLGVTPEFIIVKRRDGTSNWRVWHKDLGSTESLILNSTSAVVTGGSYFKDPPADADKIYPGGAGEVNTSGVPYITYLFASVPGISKVGSYSGNGGSTPQTIDCGFSSGARFVMIKRTDTGSSGDWLFWDSERGITTGNDPYLKFNTTQAQNTASTLDIEPDSSGFIVQDTSNAINNASGTYIFLAIA